MSVPIITVVAGPAGCGKTTWISQQMQNRAKSENVIYFSPGNGNVSIDQTRLGQDLDESAIRQTLADCYLSEFVLEQYQQQVKQILVEENIQ
ncbi:hypothetical protein [Fortiea contorta]|uniref:hypothetical protein n=1 Tax=Fortiea contorta TaxID=1892405 RepID=UPI00034C7931